MGKPESERERERERERDQLGGTIHKVAFENRVLRRIFGPKGDEVKRKWRKLHNEQLNDLYCSPNIVRVSKPRRMR